MSPDLPLSSGTGSGLFFEPGSCAVATKASSGMATKCRVVHLPAPGVPLDALGRRQRRVPPSPGASWRIAEFTRSLVSRDRSAIPTPSEIGGAEAVEARQAESAGAVRDTGRVWRRPAGPARTPPRTRIPPPPRPRVPRDRPCEATTRVGHGRTDRYREGESGGTSWASACASSTPGRGRSGAVRGADPGPSSHPDSRRRRW
jgi:hypothetical protein